MKHKARLVTKGYVQRQDVDFEGVFAAVARLETVGLIIGVMALQLSKDGSYTIWMSSLRWRNGVAAQSEWRAS